MPRTRKFLFDLDDTLMPNQHYYKIQQARMVKLIVDNVFADDKGARRAARELLEDVIDQGYRVPPLKAVLKHEVHDDTGILERIIEATDRLDLKNLRQFKRRGEPYDKERFPKTCRDTYLYFCKSEGMRVDEEIAGRAYDLGADVFNVEPRLMWGAKRVLDFLQEKGDDLYILTKGDPEVQTRKMQLNHIERWIPEDHWHIVPEKSTAVFRRVTKGMGLSRMYMVGNSQKSDINPAISAGANAIYVPFYTWFYEESEKLSVPVEQVYALDKSGEVAELENGRQLFTLENITDLIDVYDEL